MSITFRLLVRSAPYHSVPSPGFFEPIQLLKELRFIASAGNFNRLTRDVIERWPAWLL